VNDLSYDEREGAARLASSPRAAPARHDRPGERAATRVVNN
jgi:hypothetical protein